MEVIVKVRGKLELDRFCKKYKECNYKDSFTRWYENVKQSNWDKPSDVLNTFNTADPSYKTEKGNIVCIFNSICSSRLICTIDYDRKVVILQEALTHVEYDKNKWKKRY